jgi:predicted AlkP superfamily pyrophosphatase or phosphodiesterase
LILLSFLVFPASCNAALKPRLIVAVIVDQFRYDYPTRFRANYRDGIARLLDNGAVFTDARYIQYPTVTAIIHSTFLSGATPSVSAVIANDRYDRNENRMVSGDSKEQSWGPLGIGLHDAGATP